LLFFFSPFFPFTAFEVSSSKYGYEFLEGILGVTGDFDMVVVCEGFV
jgi:hypothetical protein